MKDKLSKLLMLIRQNREEISEITKSANEFYFKFRGKNFSVTSETTSAEAFFAYPKWTATLQELAQASNDSAGLKDLQYVYLTGAESLRFSGVNAVKDLYEWIDSKDLGLDVLFADLGIE